MNEYKYKVDTYLNNLSLNNEIIKNIRIYNREESSYPKDTYEERMIIRIELTKILGIYQTEEIIYKVYNKNIRNIQTVLTPFIIEIRYMIQYIKYYIKNINNIPKCIEEYWLNDNTFFERFYIRLEMLNNGWNISTIEKLINRYHNLYFAENKIIISNSMTNLLKKYLNIEYVNNNKLKGRPKCPENIKKIINKYRNNKCKTNISIKYDIYNYFQNKIKEEELLQIINILDKTEIGNKQILINKIKNFYNFTKK